MCCVGEDWRRLRLAYNLVPFFRSQKTQSRSHHVVVVRTTVPGIFTYIYGLVAGQAGDCRDLRAERSDHGQAQKQGQHIPMEIQWDHHHLLPPSLSAFHGPLAATLEGRWRRHIRSRCLLMLLLLLLLVHCILANASAIGAAFGCLLLLLPFAFRVFVDGGGFPDSNVA